ncbi:MAG: PEGA domain-containing protein [Myxococcales bacterium]|nr:PEGA domain-containing protein [Myxococcales bacterium]
MTVKHSIAAALFALVTVAQSPASAQSAHTAQQHTARAAQSAQPARSAQTAQPSPAELAEARSLFDQGIAAADEGRYADAVTAFERSMQLRPSPVVQYNLAMAYRGVGRLLDAITAFERYLANPGARATRESLAETQRALEGVRAEVPELRFALAPSEATATIDGRPIASLGEALRVDPGRHVIEVTASDYTPQRLELDLQRSERRTVQATLVQTAADARVAVESNVDGATITFDGRLVGQRRATVDATPGTHRIIVDAPGYRRVTRSVTVGRHGIVRVDVVLQRGGGIPAWGVGLLVGGGVALAVGITVPAVLATLPIEPAPIVTPPNYWGSFSFR